MANGVAKPQSVEWMCLESVEEALAWLWYTKLQPSVTTPIGMKFRNDNLSQVWIGLNWLTLKCAGYCWILLDIAGCCWTGSTQVAERQFFVLCVCLSCVKASTQGGLSMSRTGHGWSKSRYMHGKYELHHPTRSHILFRSHFGKPLIPSTHNHTGASECERVAGNNLMACPKVSRAWLCFRSPVRHLRKPKQSPNLKQPQTLHPTST